MLGIEALHAWRLRCLLKQAEQLSVKRLMSVPPDTLQQTAAGRTGAMESHPSDAFRITWQNILERLHLSPAQRTTMIAAGNAALDQLRAVYEVLRPYSPVR